MITREEVELLATLLARAGVTQIEALWANNVLNQLRVLASVSQPGPAQVGESRESSPQSDQSEGL